ncbi:MAG: HD domain-containing phosphohydrolase, partial [Acidimicrobiales bacterium]
MERVLRQTVIAMRLADLASVAPEVSAATYYTSLLTWVACATDTSELAELFGDETTLYADTHDDDLAGVTMAVFIARHLGHGRSRLRR